MVNIEGLRRARMHWKMRRMKQKLRNQRKKYERELQAEKEAIKKKKERMKEELKAVKSKIKAKPVEIVIPEARQIRGIAPPKKIIDKLAEGIVHHRIPRSEIKERLRALPIEERAKLEGEVRMLEDEIIAEKEGLGVPLTKAEENFLKTASREEKSHILYLAKMDIVAERVALEKKLTREQEKFYDQIKSNPRDMEYFRKALERIRERGY